MALEYTAFLKLQTKIDLDSILKNPEQIKNITEIDLKYVLIGTIAEKYQKDKKLLEKDITRNGIFGTRICNIATSIFESISPETF